MFKINNYTFLAASLLRWSMALVFFWFGQEQLRNPGRWTSLVPDWIQTFGFEASSIVFINGIFEISFSILLFLGIFTRFSSLVLFLHLAAITLNAGFNGVGVRDFGLTIATLVIFLNGSDKFCLENKIKLFKK